MYLEVLITPVPQSDQTIGWYLVQIEDITNIKLSELALRESEHKYREVFSNVSLGLILFEFTNEGEPGRIIDANPRALEMVGMSLPDIHDQDIPIRAFLPISGSSMVRELTVIDTDICTFESGIIRNVDDILPVQVTLDIFRLEDNVVGLAIIEDITQKRQYEEERYRLIEQIEKNLAELSILNDGVRNPLTIIMMIVEELDETISGPVIRQIRIIDDLINQLDKRWIESDKILQYLQKYHHIRYKL
jgi:PAS domain S-box-containing protein